MERFTKRTQGGVVLPIPLGSSIGRSRINPALECLAAYEDTGLTPAEVAEYAKAKTEGRVAVLPPSSRDARYQLIFDMTYRDTRGDGSFYWSGLEDDEIELRKTLITALTGLKDVTSIEQVEAWSDAALKGGGVDD